MTNDEMLKATSGADTDADDDELLWPEKRQDIIGQNGNDGLVYMVEDNKEGC